MAASMLLHGGYQFTLAHLRQMLKKYVKWYFPPWTCLSKDLLKFGFPCELEVRFSKVNAYTAFEKAK